MFEKYRIINVYSLTTFLLGISILMSSCETVTEINEETYSLISLISIVTTATAIGFLSVIVFYELWRLFIHSKNKKISGQMVPESSSIESETKLSPSNEEVLEKSDLDSRTASFNNALDEIRSLNTKISEIAKTIESTNILRNQKTEIEKELKRYVNGYNYSQLELAITDLIDAHELTSEIDKRLENNSSFNKEEAIGYINEISAVLQQGIEMVGIEQFAPDVGSLYLESLGTELGEKIAVQHENEIGTIAKIMQPGWRTHSPEDETKKKILRKAVVAVYTDPQ